MSNALEKNIRTLGDPKASTGIFKLPSGYLAPDSTLHDEIQLREMTGAEEDILSGPGSVMSKLNTIIGNCVIKVGTITDKKLMHDIVMNIPAVDRVCILLMLRAITINDEYSFDANCPGCKTEGSYTVVLSSLKVKDMEDKKKRVFDLKLPSGKTVQIKTLLGKDEHDAAEIAKKFPNDLASAAMMTRIAAIEGTPATLETIKTLSWKDTRFIRTELKKIDPTIDTLIENTCQTCKRDFSVELDIGSASFFFPSEIGNS
jgi:hypothetical protein